ncbi:hypothetical protein ABN357_14910 [Providencia rettgeri]|uniref:hypothetical protein n=1 Tax=Providencia TaxID=586 RepID=UPI00234B902A|nr:MULTISPECIES: hypothetical protein [unclassified Providencia]
MSDYISSLSVFLAALTFISGVNAWKREFIGRKKIDLYEKALNYIYKARESISYIRMPISSQSEGSTRKKGPNETSEESEILDRAFVTMERFKKSNTLFDEIRILHHQINLISDDATVNIFNTFHSNLDKLYRAARIHPQLVLNQGNKPVDSLNTQLIENLRIIYSSGDDEIENNVNDLLDIISLLYSRELISRYNFCRNKEFIKKINHIKNKYNDKK